MAELVMGIKHLRDGVETQTVLGSDMSIIGIIGTAPSADAVKYPLNKLVELRTNDKAERIALGTSGTIVDALAGISAQLSGAAKTQIIRVAHDADPFKVIASIVGSEAAGTGVWAFLNGPEDLGGTARLLIAPGYTSQASTGLSSVAVSVGGIGYTTAPTVAFSGGGGSGASAHSVVVDGVVTSIVIDNPGEKFTSAPTVTLSGGGGSGAVALASIQQVANAVCAVMPAICARLKAKFLPEGPTGSRQAAIDWLETLPRSENILHPLRQDAKLTVEGITVTKPLSPYIIALYARRDSEFDGRPFHSIANQSIYGLVGVSPTIPLSITDENSLGQDDLAKSFGIVSRGDVGSDSSLSDGGFIFWGTDTLSSNSDWLFANVVRGRDYIELMQVRVIRIYLGKFNITIQTVQATLNTLESQLSKLRFEKDIIDYRLGFEPDANSPEELRLGHLDVTFQAEEPPVFRKLTIRSRRHKEALASMVKNISIALGTQIAA